MKFAIVLTGSIDERVVRSTNASNAYISARSARVHDPEALLLAMTFCCHHRHVLPSDPSWGHWLSLEEVGAAPQYSLPPPAPPATHMQEERPRCSMRMIGCQPSLIALLSIAPVAVVFTSTCTFVGNAFCCICHKMQVQSAFFPAQSQIAMKLLHHLRL